MKEPTHLTNINKQISVAKSMLQDAELQLEEHANFENASCRFLSVIAHQAIVANQIKLLKITQAQHNNFTK